MVSSVPVCQLQWFEQWPLQHAALPAQVCSGNPFAGPPGGETSHWASTTGICGGYHALFSALVANVTSPDSEWVGEKAPKKPRTEASLRPLSGG
jgi:hypothetical protein